MPNPKDLDPSWIEKWLDAVEAGRATMSQRTVSSIEAHGGLQAAVNVARLKGVHLVKLTDDKGNVLVAASRHSFEALC